MKRKIFLILLILLAFFLRFINIDSNPPAMYGDELTLVYDAYSILKTGHDQTGAYLPLTFSMSEGRPPLYVYLTVPFVAIFGPNAFSARIVSVISGALLVLAGYWLTRKLFHDKVGLIAAFLITISPWDLTLSRGGFETHLALLLTVLAILSYLGGKEKPGRFILSALFFGLAFFTYHSYKVISPLVLVILLFYQPISFNDTSTHSKKYLVSIIMSVAIIFIFGSVWLIQAVQGSEARFRSTNIFAQSTLKQQIIEKINYDRDFTTVPYKSLFHNKAWEYLFVLGDNYLNHYSLNFLFLHGDTNPRHNQAGMGMFYIIEIFTVLAGILFLLKTHQKEGVFLLGLSLIAPLPTIIVSEPHALRSSFLFLPGVIVSSLGLYYLIKLAAGNTYFKIVLLLLSFGLLVQFILLIDNIYYTSPGKYGNFWSLPAKKLSLRIEEESTKYDRVYVSDKIDSIDVAYQVYNKIDPTEIISQSKNNIKHYGNVTIREIKDEDIESLLGNGRSVFIGPLGDYTLFKDVALLDNSSGIPIYLISHVK